MHESARAATVAGVTGHGMAVDTQSSELISAVALLGSAVIAVPIFKRLGLGSVIGYLVAGLVIGPSVLGLFRDPEAILGVAEFGVVLLLFVIGWS